MRKFLLKRLLPFLASVITVDIDTVQRATSKCLRVRVEVMMNTVLDEEICIKTGDEIDERLSNH